MTTRPLPFPELAGHLRIASQRLADLSPTDAGRGLIVEEVDLEALVRDDPRFTAVPVRAELGLQVECHLGRPSVFLFSAPGPLSIARGPDAALSDHQGTIALDLVRLEHPALLRAAGGRYIVLERRDQGLEVQAFAPDAAPRAAPTIESPVSTWVTGDPWLSRATAARVATGDPYDQVVAVGLAWRLAILDPAAQRARVERLLSNRPAPADLRERDWARSVPREAWGWVEQRALRGVASLRDRLDGLLDMSSSPDEAILGACHDRDLLEGVALALQAASSSADLDPALEAVDVIGSATLGALPPLHLDDEQLRRAAAVDPDAWWVQPASAAERGR